MPTARAGTLGVALNGVDPDPNPHRLLADYAWYDAAFDLSAPSGGPPPPPAAEIVGGPGDGPNMLEFRQTGAPFGSVQTQFSVTAGALPPGVKLVHKEVRAVIMPGSLNPWPSGVQNEFGWAGVPTELGVFNVTIGASGGYGGGDFTWTISLAGGCPLITIDPDVIDLEFVGEPIALTFTATDGVGPYVWDVADGALPDGLTFSSGGVLEGAPTTAGDYTFTLRATDDNDCPGVVAFALSIVEPDPIVVLPSDATLAPGARGWLYVSIFTAEDGIGPPYAFTISDGDLPDGLALSVGGVLAGLPSVAGSFVFTVRATDEADNFGEREYTLQLTGLRIIIAGVDVTIDVAAADLELGLNRQGTGALELGDGYIPARGADVLIYARDGITPIFGGLVLSRRVQGMTASNPANRTDADLVDYSIFFDDADPITIVSTVDQDLEDVVASIVSQSLAVYGITYDEAPTGQTVPPIEWNAINVSDAFKRITDATGVVFRVLPLKELEVFSPLDDPAPVSITDANVNSFDLTWQDPQGLSKNTVDLTCGPTGTGIADQHWTADGIVTAWEVDIQAVLGTATPAHRANAYLSNVDATNFAAGDSIGAGGSTYTFRASLIGDVAGEVLIGATVEDSLENLNAAINLAGGGVYAPSTAANADVSSYMRAPGTLEADALTAGAAGNAITVASSHGAIAFWYGEGGTPRSTLQLGADATGVAGWTQGYVLENGSVLRTLSTPAGADGYYFWDVTVGRGTLSIGLGAPPAAGTDLELKYLAVFPFHAIVSSGSPPRTFREAHPEIIEYAAGIALATQILARESADRRELEVFTDVDGFLPGQALDVDTTYRGGIVALFLVATVRVKLVNAELWEYSITNQQSDEYAGSFVDQWKSLTSGGGSAAASGTLVDGGAAISGDIYSDGRQSFRAAQSMGGHKLTFVDDPASAQDAATKAYTDAGDAGTIKANGSVPFTAAQSMGSHKLTSVTDPTSAQDASTKNYTDAGDAAVAAVVAAANYIKRDGSVAFTADQSMGTHKLTNVVDPGGAQDAATKAYVDAAIAGVGTTAGGLVLLASQTASSSADLSFATRNATGQSGAIFQSDYDDYLIEFVNVIPATNAVTLGMRMSTNGGSTYDSGANYKWAYQFSNTAGATGASNSAAGTSITIAGSYSNTSSAGAKGTVEIAGPLSASQTKPILLRSAFLASDANYYHLHGMGLYNSTTAVDAVRFLMSSGNIASGTIRIYGIKK